MKTETCKLYSSLLNISAKYHRNRSTSFWGIPFQSSAVFWDTEFHYFWNTVVTEHFAKSDTAVLSRSLKVDIDLVFQNKIHKFLLMFSSNYGAVTLHFQHKAKATYWTND